MRSIPIAVLMLAWPTFVSGQRFADSSRYAVSFSYGSFEYDLSRTGKSRMVALRIERPIAKFVMAEAGILYARPYNQSGDSTHFWVPEIQVQVQLPLRVIAPYIGVGGGVAYDSGHDSPTGPQQRGHVTDPTFSAAAGVRAWFTSVFGARLEMRVRGIGGDFQGSSTEWTLGAALRL